MIPEQELVERPGSVTWRRVKLALILALFLGLVVAIGSVAVKYARVHAELAELDAQAEALKAKTDGLNEDTLARREQVLTYLRDGMPLSLTDVRQIFRSDEEQSVVLDIVVGLLDHPIEEVRNLGIMRVRTLAWQSPEGFATRADTIATKLAELATESEDRVEGLSALYALDSLDEWAAPVTSELRTVVRNGTVEQRELAILILLKLNPTEDYSDELATMVRSGYTTKVNLERNLAGIMRNDLAATIIEDVEAKLAQETMTP